MEHKPCGTVCAASAFQTADRRTCSDCGGDEGTFTTVGTFVECDGCDYRFDGHSTSSTPSVRQTPLPSPDTHRSLRGYAISSGKVLFTALLVAIVVTAGVGNAVFTPVSLSRSPDDVVRSGDSDVPTTVSTDGTRTWRSYQTIVIFRNDDIQAHYRSDAREAVHDVFVDEKVPVTEGIIPYIGNQSIVRSGQVCEALRERKARHPDLFEYALHGYTHAELTDFHGGSEFGGLPQKHQRQRIARGKRIVRRCVGETPTTFIPPLDTYDRATVRALDAEGFDTVSGGGWFTQGYYGRDDPFERGGVVHVPNSYAFVENWTTNDLHERAELRRAFDRAYQNGSVYVQMLHYPQFKSASNLARLRWFIEHVKSRDGVRFMTLGEFAVRFRHGTVERTEEGWRVYETGARSRNETASTPEEATQPGRISWTELRSTTQFTDRRPRSRLRAPAAPSRSFALTHTNGRQYGSRSNVLTFGRVGRAVSNRWSPDVLRGFGLAGTLYGQQNDKAIGG